MAKHLETKHGISKETPQPSPSNHRAPTDSVRSRNERPQEEDAEEEEPPDASRQAPLKRKKQAPLGPFLVAKHSARNDTLRLICEDNMTLNQVLKSKAVRRLVSRSYPGEPPLPKSTTTLSKHLREDAWKVRGMLKLKFKELRAEGIPSTI